MGGTIRTPRKRLLASLLAAILTLSLIAPPAGRAAAESGVTGSVSATLRIDYEQSLEELRERNVQVEVLQGGASLGVLPLYESAETTLGQYPAAVTHRSRDGGELGGGSWPGYLDLEVKGLPQGSYTLRFTGRGYVTCEETVNMTDCAWHVIAGTGDATFTLGDVNGDGRVDEKDRAALTAALGSRSPADVTAYDLSGDGRIDITDLAYVNRQLKVQGGAEQLETTWLGVQVDMGTTQADLGKQPLTVEGSLEDLFVDNGSAVTFRPNSGQTSMTIPLTLSKAMETEEIQITCPTAGAPAAGTVEVEDANGKKALFNLPDGEAVPDDVHAIGRVEGKNVITINLGTRVAVKKVTITVTKLPEGGYTTVETIQFLKDIVPENPAPANSVVKGLTAVPGNESVSLSWNVLPNVSGYKVLYWLQSSPSTVQELHVDVTSAQVTGLDNLKTYVFTVTPTDGTWEGKPSAPVTAMPIPSKVPDKTDMVTVTAMDGALRVSWKAGKIATYYEVHYCEKGTEQWQQAGGRLTDTSVTIDNLTNGVTYTLYVVAGNDIGLGPRSDIAEGTPEAVKIERPEGIPTEGLLDRSKIASAQLADKNNYDRNSYTANKPFAPENVIDGDYATHWTAATGGSNWNRDEHIIVTFTEPVNLSNALWVPRLDGAYPTYLRAYSFRVWYEGDDLSSPGTQIVPHPSSGISDAAGAASNWPNVPNFSTLSSDRFAIMPLGNQKNVVKISIAAEQRDYYTVSCSELLFMEYDPEHDLDGDVAKLFANDLHTQLAEGVTAETVSALKERLAGDERKYCLYPNTLADELALAEELLNTKKSSGVVIEGVDARKADSRASSSDLQPLGVTAKAGDEITIYASGIPAGQSLTVHATQFNSEVSGWRGSMGTLVNGRNVLKVPQLSSKAGVDHGGSLYFTYSGTNPEGISLHVRRATDIPALDLSDWYKMDEAARRDTIGSYIDELDTYLGGITIANDTGDYRNVTEITTPVMLLSLPAKAVQKALGGATPEQKIETLYDNVLAWEDIMHICKITHGIDETYANNTLTGRQNIRCMTMFAGAFMYAAGNHVGIGYGSCNGMVVGKPIPQMNGDANRLFGWGIAHEIGHNMDRLGKAETTNNIYSLMVQTYDGADNTLASRLENSGKYQRIFNKVAQGYPGASGDVFTQLGMYWQLHLAYDEGKSDSQHGPMWFFNQFSKDWAAGTYTAGASSYDDKVALTAAGVVGKDLTEFFTRWGMVLSESTKTTLASYDKETRAIWYLSDQSRRNRLNGTGSASGQVVASLSQSSEGGKNNVIEVSINANGLTGDIQGYEILRNDQPIAFVMADQTTYRDVIGSGNHRTYEYQVVAYDTLGNQIGEATEKKQVRVAYDMVVDRNDYEIQRDKNNNVVITMEAETAVSGLKLKDVNPGSGSFTVTVTGAATGEEGQTAEQTWTALTGDFSNNQATDDPSSFVAYFKVPGKVPGAEADDTRIWTYDAKTVTIEGIPADIALEAVQLISYAGDDIAFWGGTDGATVGLLENDYDYGAGVIKAGTLVIVGTFRGDPVYNTIMVEGEFTGTSTTENNELAPVEYVRRPINGYSLLFATEPAFGDMCDISDGIFIFVPDVQREAEIQDNKDASHCTMTNLLPSRIMATLYRTDDPENTVNKRTTAQTIWISCPGGSEEDLPKIVITSDGGAAQ